MNIIFQHGFCHTLVIDADNKFWGIFKQTMSMLKFNVHWASSNNHDSILVKGFNLFFNKGLIMILCAECSTTHMFDKVSQLLTYEWNFVYMAETDIFRSLVAVGRELSLPIYLVDQPSPSISSKTSTKLQLTDELRLRLKVNREVYKVLTEEHKCMHQDYVHACCINPFLFNVGDLVWCQRQIQSNKT